jgi:CRISPR/Cas system endoribonuclease Cas6 (RAMP superfamily)
MPCHSAVFRDFQPDQLLFVLSQRRRKQIKEREPDDDDFAGSLYQNLTKNFKSIYNHPELADWRSALYEFCICIRTIDPAGQVYKYRER